MKKFKENRSIMFDDLRNLCINKEWYTKGNNEEYSKLFKRLKEGTIDYKNLTTKDLYEVANDIKEHSDTQYEISDIMFELNKISITLFEEIQ